MRKALLSLVGAAALLAGCTIDPASVATDIQTACSLEVDAAQIASVISSNPNLTNAEAIAAMICQAFAQQQAATSPTVSGKLTAPAPGATVKFNVINANGTVQSVTGTVKAS